MDMTGRQVRTISMSSQTSATHQVIVNAEGLPSGAYIYRLRAGDDSESKIFTLIH
jgi:hypothetical protein